MNGSTTAGARSRRDLIVLALAVCGVGMVVVAALGCGRVSRREGSLAGVLDTKGRVIVVDLESGRVVRKAKLRSWAFDIVADQSNRTFVTAQSGGADIDADNKVGVVPASGPGRVKYIDLRRPNPYGVELVGDGKVLVDHGWDEKQGMYVCVVDTNRRRVIRDGYVPDLNLSPRVIDGVAWVCCAQVDGRRSLRQLDPLSLTSDEVLWGDEFPLVETAGRDGLYGWLVAGPGQAGLARFNPKTGAVEATAAVDFEDGPGRLVFERGVLVAADFSGSDLENGGARLMVFDPGTLALKRTIRVPGGPCDLAVWRDRVVVCSYRDQQLLIVDPVTGRTERRIQLPKMTKLPFQVAVLD